MTNLRNFSFHRWTRRLRCLGFILVRVPESALHLLARNLLAQPLLTAAMQTPMHNVIQRNLRQALAACLLALSCGEFLFLPKRKAFLLLDDRGRLQIPRRMSVPWMVAQTMCQPARLHCAVQ